MNYAIFKPLYWNNNLSPRNKNWIFRFSIFQSTCSLILRVVSHLFVEIIKSRFDFPMVAMGEPDPGDEPHPWEWCYYRLGGTSFFPGVVVVVVCVGTLSMLSVPNNWRWSGVVFWFSLNFSFSFFSFFSLLRCFKGYFGVVLPRVHEPSFVVVVQVLLKVPPSRCTSGSLPGIGETAPRHYHLCYDTIWYIREHTHVAKLCSLIIREPKRKGLLFTGGRKEGLQKEISHLGRTFGSNVW